MISQDQWLKKSEKERYEHILTSLNSGAIEIVYARLESVPGLFYVTMKPPKDSPAICEEATHEKV